MKNNLNSDVHFLNMKDWEICGLRVFHPDGNFSLHVHCAAVFFSLWIIHLPRKEKKNKQHQWFIELPLNNLWGQVKKVSRVRKVLRTLTCPVMQRWVVLHQAVYQGFKGASTFLFGSVDNTVISVAPWKVCCMKVTWLLGPFFVVGGCVLGSTLQWIEHVVNFCFYVLTMRTN